MNKSHRGLQEEYVHVENRLYRKTRTNQTVGMSGIYFIEQELQMATVYVTLPVPLRKFSKGGKKIKVDADTVLEALLKLNDLDRSMSERLLETDHSEPKKFIRIYLDGKDIRKTGGLSTLVQNENKLDIVTAFAGG